MAWKAIKPKPFKPEAFQRNVIKTMTDVGAGFKHDFDATTKTWNRKVPFDTVLETNKIQASVTVSTGDDIYRFVNDGTKPHEIRAKNARVLSFRGGYTAKTSPGVIGSGGGGASGSMMHAKSVHHPGTKARNFDEAILRKWKTKLAKELGITMRKFSEESGHAI